VASRSWISPHRERSLELESVTIGKRSRRRRLTGAGPRSSGVRYDPRELPDDACPDCAVTMKNPPVPRREAVPEYGGERDEERFWREVQPRDEPLNRRWFLPAVVLLMVLSMPWYLRAGDIGPIVGGLPAWVWIPRVCSAAISAVTCYAALRAWDDDED